MLTIFSVIKFHLCVNNAQVLRDGFLVIVAGPGGEDGGGAAHSLGHHHITTGSPGEGRSSELVEYQLSELNSQGEEQGVTQLSLQTCITQHRSGGFFPPTHSFLISW